jgi:hypothetical protein
LWHNSFKRLEIYLPISFVSGVDRKFFGPKIPLLCILFMTFDEEYEQWNNICCSEQQVLTNLFTSSIVKYGSEYLAFDMFVLNSESLSHVMHIEHTNNLSKTCSTTKFNVI